MSWITIELKENQTQFLPGDEIEGTASWHLDEDPESVEIRLFWYTQGKGTQDVGVMETILLQPAVPDESNAFRFKVPEGPYSFSGKLISVLWAIEVIAIPSKEAQRYEIVVSPTGREIVLQTS